MYNRVNYCPTHRPLSRIMHLVGPARRTTNTPTRGRGRPKGRGGENDRNIFGSFLSAGQKQPPCLLLTLGSRPQTQLCSPFVDGRGRGRGGMGSCYHTCMQPTACATAPSFSALAPHRSLGADRHPRQEHSFARDLFHCASTTFPVWGMHRGVCV